jgi:hypothetical protein
MAHDPADRFATAAEFRAEIDAFLETSKRVGGEEIGKLVRETFAADRQRVLALVEAQMRVMTAPASAADAPPPPPVVEAAPLSRRDQSEPRDSTMKVTAASAPSRAEKPGEAGRGRLLLGVGIALGAALIVFVLLRNTGSTSGSAVNAGAGSAAPSGPAGKPATVDVWISVEPPEARLTLDEVALASNPFHAAMPESAMARRLRVSAPGFTTDERLITLDRDIHLEMSLKAAPTSPTATSSSVGAPASSAPVALGAPRLPGAMLPPSGVGKPAATAAAGPAPGEAIAPAPKKSTRSIDDTF